MDLVFDLAVGGLGGGHPLVGGIGMVGELDDLRSSSCPAIEVPGVDVVMTTMYML